MSRQVAFKAALLVLLAAAVLITRSTLPWYSSALMGFGAFNVLVTPRGTFGVRMTAVAAAIITLLLNERASGPWWVVVVLAWAFIWLAWAPAFMVTWALAAESDRVAAASSPDAVESGSRARLAVAAIIVAVAIASATYRMLYAHAMQQTAALFIGIPALLAIVVVFAASPRSAVGVSCKAVTVGLLVSLVFLGEGLICVLMTAPLFYAVAIAVAATIERARARSGTNRLFFSSLVVLATVPFSLEGTTRTLTIDRRESVSATRIVAASADRVAGALVAQPHFDRAVAPFLAAGFPRPTSATIERHDDGVRWNVRVRGGEMRLDGMEARSGELILRLERQQPGFIRWQVLSDKSHTTHFLRWRESRVRWEALDAATTRVTWTLEYDRGLDPAWYFGPWERYAARLAADYLIDAVATP